MEPELYRQYAKEIEANGGQMRQASLARALGVARPSVNTGCRRMIRDGFAMIATNGALQLTEAGHVLAVNVRQAEKAARRLCEDLELTAEQIERIAAALDAETVDKILGQREG